MPIIKLFWIMFCKMFAMITDHNEHQIIINAKLLCLIDKFANILIHIMDATVIHVYTIVDVE